MYAVVLLAAVSLPPRPNIISIVTDDQAPWSLGVYGNRESRTPHTDRLAAEGARFTNAFSVTPVCSPSRATFLTGRYGAEFGITDWIHPDEDAAGVGLPSGTVTWPLVLQKAGYVTGLIGKWHLGGKADNHPTRMGLTHFVGLLGGGGPTMNPTWEVDGKPTKLEGPASDLIVDHGLKFVERNKDRPFALLLHFREPHLPYTPMPAADTAPFRTLDPTLPPLPAGVDVNQLKKWTREYYGAVHAVDRNLGRLLARLKELGLADKTIVMLTSDHGYMIGHHGLHTKGNAMWVAGGVEGPRRPNMFDLSLRVPLIIRWPGVVEPGKVFHETVSNLDTFATVLGMLGVPIPAGVTQRGADVSPLLRGQTIPQREAFFGQYDLHNNGLAFMRMIRTSRYKLVRHLFTHDLDELYDIEADPGEMRNLYRSKDHAKTRDELEGKLGTWRQSIGDPLLTRGPSVPRVAR